MAAVLCFFGIAFAAMDVSKLSVRGRLLLGSIPDGLEADTHGHQDAASPLESTSLNATSNIPGFLVRLHPSNCETAVRVGSSQ